MSQNHKFVKISSLVTEIKKIEEIVLFYIASIYSKSMANIANEFYFRLYDKISNFVGVDSLGEKLKIFDIFPSIFMAPTCVRDGFSRGVNTFLTH